jgi:hypothetical protein
VKAKDQEVTLELNGGVDTRIFVQQLRDGDHIAFEEAVLKTRPAPDALTWPLPLSAWAGKVEVTPNEKKLLAGLAGTTIYPTPGFPPAAGRGGVYADVPVSEADIRKKK